MKPFPYHPNNMNIPYMDAMGLNLSPKKKVPHETGNKKSLIFAQQKHRLFSDKTEASVYTKRSAFFGAENCC